MARTGPGTVPFRESSAFTQEDPIGIAGGLNLYGYAGGDPINYSDPLGLCPWCPAAIGAAIGLGVEGIRQFAHRDFDWRALATAGATGALSGEFAVLKAGRVGMIAGQAAIGAIGGLIGGGDEKSFGSPGDVAQAAAFGAAGEIGGQVLDLAAVSKAGEFKSYLDAFIGHHLENGVPQAELDRFRTVVMDVYANRRSELAGVVAGFVQGWMNR